MICQTCGVEEATWKSGAPNHSIFVCTDGKKMLMKEENWSRIEEHKHILRCEDCGQEVLL